jgi:gamma-glutamyltranspeptidase/glutathione hydrolase
VNYGAVAAGHEKTAEAAQIILKEGGNAYDAALAALCSACVAEPVLASMGGGGFLLALPKTKKSRLYDFFVQTPCRKKDLASIDFRPIMADFGNTRQEFHIGLGAAATPGMLKGLFKIHRDLCRMPLRLIMQPAIELARQGVPINPFQHYIATIVEPILRASPDGFALHQSPTAAGQLAAIGERVPVVQFADALEQLAHEGEDLFYRGEMGQALAQQCQTHGGYLTRQDLASYQVSIRSPMRIDYHGASLLTNPPPSLGGLLIGFTLTLLRATPLRAWRHGSAQHLFALATAMQVTQLMRNRSALHERLDELRVDSATLEAMAREYQHLLQRHPPGSRGTTQISILDRDANLASMTLSNGEGCGYVLAETGIMINNMLGEEDVNPHGFHCWPTNRRIASMMAPSALRLADGSLIATGSGGSNRIRSAILQVVSHLVDFDMDVAAAVTTPRVHYESGLLHIEPPRLESELATLAETFPEQKYWDECNLFFGGAHSVQRHPNGKLEGMGDPRRGGVCRIVT